MVDTPHARMESSHSGLISAPGPAWCRRSRDRPSSATELCILIRYEFAQLLALLIKSVLLYRMLVLGCCLGRASESRTSQVLLRRRQPACASAPEGCSYTAPDPATITAGDLDAAQNEACSFNLTPSGWLAAIALLLLFFPLAWLPCCMLECRQVRNSSQS